MKKLLVLSSIILFSFALLAQRDIKESATIPMFSVSYSFQSPLEDMADRFGNNSNVGVSFTLKGKKGWLIGIDGSFLFAGQLKEDSLLHGIMTSNGNIINQYGEYSNIVLSQRGYYAGVKVGKVINIIPSMPNSGIYVTGSVGFLEHRIKIENESNNAPQVLNDYAKGYDRLTNGLAVKGFLGYMHIGKSQFANFYGGVEYLQSWTQSRRDFNFDDKKANTETRSDNLVGVRVGWIIPLYRRVPDSYFTF